MTSTRITRFTDWLSGRTPQERAALDLARAKAFAGRIHVDQLGHLAIVKVSVVLHSETNPTAADTSRAFNDALAQVVIARWPELRDAALEALAYDASAGS